MDLDIFSTERHLSLVHNVDIFPSCNAFQNEVKPVNTSGTCKKMRGSVNFMCYQ
ncbi:hypothetical protein HDU97_008067 [Phlyctochytrium planicorne]|nr:hypothetical protein HDU97_008067 [Phlyctochytrium planicorne]